MCPTNLNTKSIGVVSYVPSILYKIRLALPLLESWRQNKGHEADLGPYNYVNKPSSLGSVEMNSKA